MHGYSWDSLYISLAFAYKIKWIYISDVYPSVSTVLQTGYCHCTLPNPKRNAFHQKKQQPPTYISLTYKNSILFLSLDDYYHLFLDTLDGAVVVLIATKDLLFLADIRTAFLRVDMLLFVSWCQLKTIASKLGKLCATGRCYKYMRRRRDAATERTLSAGVKASVKRRQEPGLSTCNMEVREQRD